MQHTVLEQVWNPTQHIALWLGAWLSGLENYDHLLDALESLGGPSTESGSLVLADAIVPEVVDLGGDLNRSDMLHLVRAVTQAGDWKSDSRPLVRLILSGPGEAPGLPAGSAAANAAKEAGAAIVIADAEPGYSHVLVPLPATWTVLNSPQVPVVSAPLQWHWYTLEGHLPEPAYLLPGEADLQLAEATRLAAAAIATMPSGSVTSSSAGTARKVDPRLLVGMLDDHLDLAFVPEAVPRRALGVLARADRVASILAVAQGRESDYGSSEFDAQLIPLWRHIRQVRMSAVDYAIREWTR